MAVMLVKIPTEQVRLQQSHHPMWWRLIGYLAAVLPFLFMVASLWVHPNVELQESADWRPVVALADVSWEKRDLYEARHLYLRAGRIASWHEDWEGLLAAACGMKKLDGAAGNYFSTRMILVQAMMAAETRRSRAGIAAVARAFTAIGEDKAASMVLARIRPNWPNETKHVVGVETRGC